MTKESRKLLKNKSLGVSVRVTDWRLKDAGVTLDRDLGLPARKRDHEMKIPPGLTRRLAGEIRSKRSDTKVATLRQQYGESFARGYRTNATLGTVLKREGVDSLGQLLKKRR